MYLNFYPVSSLEISGGAIKVYPWGMKVGVKPASIYPSWYESDRSDKVKMLNKFVGIYIFKFERSSFMYGTAAFRPIFISSAKGSKSISGVTLEITLRSENWSELITI